MQGGCVAGCLLGVYPGGAEGCCAGGWVVVLVVVLGGMLGAKAKGPERGSWGPFWYNSLTMTYFHTGCSTIIGAKSFHGPVRDGKGWGQLAMVIRHDG